MNHQLRSLQKFHCGGKSAHPRAKLACEASQPRLETGWLQAIKKQRDTHTHSVLCSCFIDSIIFLATLKTFSQEEPLPIQTDRKCKYDYIKKKKVATMVIPES